MKKSEKTSLMGDINALVKHQVQLLREAELLQNRAKEVVDGYNQTIDSLSRLMVEYGKEYGDLYFHDIDFAPLNMPALMGSLTEFARTEVPKLDTTPSVSDMPKPSQIPPLPDETPWRFRVVKAYGVVVGGAPKQQGDVVVLPRHMGEQLKESLQPLGPVKE